MLVIRKQLTQAICKHRQLNCYLFVYFAEKRRYPKTVATSYHIFLCVNLRQTSYLCALIGEFQRKLMPASENRVQPVGTSVSPCLRFRGICATLGMDNESFFILMACLEQYFSTRLLLFFYPFRLQVRVFELEQFATDDL